MYNLQSGMLRQSFPPRLTPAQAKKAKLQRLADGEDNLEEEKPKNHTKAVTGLMVDNLNTTVVSCGLDGKIKVRLGVFVLKLLQPLTISSFGIYSLESWCMNSTGTQCALLRDCSTAAQATLSLSAAMTFPSELSTLRPRNWSENYGAV